ncbi:Cytochrome P450 [Micromonospora citrea]|uniref:Cytochrome P450 n=1 Tax=Micromonospora citrea TaxID=47855 RepID=A0A1C6VXX5_9ACTN|nr:cytochrome P450 [Micromonospora citrea]SCL70974.1 Cytochrome P450 [Micromonospora citrea]
MQIDQDGPAGGVDVVVFGHGPAVDRLAEACRSTGRPVRTVTLPAEAVEPVGGIVDFLAHPDSPHRAVLVGAGPLGVAGLTVADRHPERVAAVVALDLPAAPPEAEWVSCPTLLLPPAPAEVDLPALGPFLDRVAADLDDASSCQVRPPALTPALLNDPETLGQLRAAGPVHRVSLVATTPTWVLTGHEVTTTTLADPRLAGEREMTAGFRLSPPGENTDHRGEQDLVTVDAELHARLRRLVAAHLTPRRVDALRPRIQRETDRLLDAIDPGSVTNLVESFARPLPIVVLCELLGVPEADRGYVEDWLVRRMREWPPDPHADVDDYLVELIAARRARPGDDLISAVVRAEGAALDEADLVSAARWLMVGGHRAPMALLANGVAALLGEPTQWRRLVDAPDLVETAVEELMRYVTPFPVGLARIASAPIDVAGRTIAADSLVAASLIAANHDPARFTDPDALDVARSANPHLSFGHGHHYCVGAALARAEAQIAFGTLARRFPGMRLAVDTRELHYRQNRMRYLLELPIVLRPSGPPAATAA